MESKLIIAIFLIALLIVYHVILLVAIVRNPNKFREKPFSLFFVISPLRWLFYKKFIEHKEKRKDN